MLKTKNKMTPQTPQIPQKTQYAEIARIYAESQDKRPLRWAITDPSLYAQIGKLEGLEVLDLACGDGRISRQLKLRGAKRVLGIDAEPEMIKIAQEKEAKDKLGIEYQVGKVGELPALGQFDLVVPGFLLHYAKSKGELLRMCQDIYRNLKKGGKMIGINQNPDNPKNLFKKYGSTVYPVEEPLIEGGLVEIILYEKGLPTSSFTNTHWKKSTYESALSLAGLKDIKWIPMTASAEAVEQKGKDFWQDWLNSPSLVILEARK